MKVKLKLRINTKILIILLGLSLIPFILFGYISLHDMKNLGHYVLEKNISLGESAVNDSKKALIDGAEKILLRLAMDQAAISNAIFEKTMAETNIMADFAATLWSNPSSIKYKRVYSQEEKSGDIYTASVYKLAPNVCLEAVRKELNLFSNMADIFIPVCANDPNLASVYIGTESGIFMEYPWSSEIEPSYDPRKREWYQRAVKTGKIGWTELYVDVSGLLMVTCYKPVYGPEGKIVGVVAADVTLNAINEKIINTQVSKHGYALLIDNNGKVIVRPELSTKDKKWDKSFQTENLLHSNNTELRKIIEDVIADNTGVAKCKFEGGEKYIAYAPICCTNWNICIIMPVDEIIASALATEDKIIIATQHVREHINMHIKGIRDIFIGIFIAISFLISGMAYVLSKRITQPILALNEGAKIIGSGNLDHHLEVKTGNEIEDLADAFNEMTKNLKTHIKELKETTAAKERIESELRVATDIQASMLPRIFPPFPKRKEFDIFATMEPAKEVGGDFYDFFFIDKNKLCFLIADVSGKGVPAALFMVISKTLLKTAALCDIPPDEILLRVNNMLCPDNDACMFVTTFCVILDTETGEMQFANGGHNPPLICNNGDFEFMQVPHNFVVGAMPNVKFECQKLILKPNDIILLYTDGVTEAMNPEAQLFSDERLKKILVGLKKKDIRDIINRIKVEINTFANGAPQSDDITMLALKFNGKKV